MPIQYIARITCACGTTISVECPATTDFDEVTFQVPRPLFWRRRRVGFSGDWAYECPGCVAREDGKAVG